LNTGEQTRKYEVEADDGDACPHDRSVMGNNGSYVMSTLPLSRGNIKHESDLRSGRESGCGPD